ncbi:MAG: hypothetical protein L0Y79_04695 [Chlorobi bacterium]|nr:hypothetical protein [Chlorobiota bacterium]MCI0717292.1 hypothetical protein [Chlorobiota bacterium]
MLKKNKILVLLLAAVFLMKGCGIFDTRDPEEPSNIRSTFVPPTTPEIVIDNLSFSILEKNSENYIKCISASNFQYVPDSKSQLLYGQIFQNWDPLAEKRYMDNLISQTNTNASSVLFLDNETITQITADSASYQADYIIVYQHNRVNLPKSATGNLLLTLNSDENYLYSITRWQDFRQNDTDFTWSELKANFSN